jgi:hypothetical protein
MVERPHSAVHILSKLEPLATRIHARFTWWTLLLLVMLPAVWRAAAAAATAAAAAAGLSRR